jgi:hypothetical protein
VFILFLTRAGKFSLLQYGWSHRNRRSTESRSCGGRHPWKSFPKPCCSQNALLITMNSVTRFTSGTGHYTQAVWARTNKVGCGFISFISPDGWYDKYYVCNYGPGGNIIGGSMYTEGDACTQCPAEASSCDNGLCV